MPGAGSLQRNSERPWKTDQNCLRELGLPEYDAAGDADREHPGPEQSHGPPWASHGRSDPGTHDSTEGRPVRS